MKDMFNMFLGMAVLFVVCWHVKGYNVASHECHEQRMPTIFEFQRAMDLKETGRIDADTKEVWYRWTDKIQEDRIVEGIERGMADVQSKQ